ncbi:MAG TPA: hypothetical protein VF846_22090 [Thermoanaerobaculia bacterium]|jgi:hypothetical protein
MSLELNAAGMTFLVGAFVILAFEAVGYFIFGRHILHFFEGQLGLSRADTTPPAVTTGVFVGLSFALGLLVEDVCHKYDDATIDWPFRFAYGTLHLGTSADDHSDTNLKAALQHSVLILNLQETQPRLSPLGKAVFASGVFEAVLGDERGRITRKWALGGGPLPQGTPGNVYEGFKEDLGAVFYFAKNRVYREDNYYDELTRIQTRLDFARTVAILGSIAACLTVAVGVALLARVWSQPRFRRHVLTRAGIVAVAFATIYVLAYHAYVRESKEYNKRVFGYYDSMLRASRLHRSPSGALSAVPPLSAAPAPVALP